MFWSKIRSPEVKFSSPIISKIKINCAKVPKKVRKNLGKFFRFCFARNLVLVFHIKNFFFSKKHLKILSVLRRQKHFGVQNIARFLNVRCWKKKKRMLLPKWETIVHWHKSKVSHLMIKLKFPT